jgi:hypothetical protein
VRGVGWTTSRAPHIFTTHTAATLTAPDTSCIAFAVFLHARTLPTFATQFMGQIRCSFISDSLFEFGIKGLWISREDVINGCLPLVFTFCCILTNVASTVPTAIYFDGKALTIQFQTFCLFACTPHRRHFLAMRRLDLARTGRSIPAFRPRTSIHAPVCLFDFQIGQSLTSQRSIRESIRPQDWSGR